MSENKHFDYMNVGDRLTIHAGVLYHGKVTEIERDGFWLTEDYETEEYISFVDVKKINELSGRDYE